MAGSGAAAAGGGDAPPVFEGDVPEELKGKVVPRYLPTYRLKPEEEEKFRPSEARKICEEVVGEVLGGKEWVGDEETLWTNNITETVRNRVRDELELKRYKIVVQTMLGEIKGQGLKVASRCLWDAETDNYASYAYKSETIWCTVLVFCMYTE